MHMAFLIAEADLESWRDRLGEFGIPIRSEIRRAKGGTSLYVHDTAGDLIEPATPGLWPNYPRGLHRGA